MEDELPLVEANQVTQEEKQLLYEQVEELKCSNAVLLAENDMFERFISCMDQQDSQAGADGLGEPGSTQLGGGVHGKRQKSRSSLSDGLHELTLEQKLYVAQRAVAETKQDQKKLKQRYERIQDNYKASLKEAEMRLEEIRRAKNVFERRLHAHMKDHRLEKKEPEKLLQYFEDKSKVTQVEKLHLKNQALKVLEKKLELQLQQKKEAAKAEYEEIFQDYSEQRMDKNLMELQANSLKVHRNLMSHKEKLQSVTSESKELSSDINKRKQMLMKLEEKMQNAEEERVREEALNQRLRRQVSDYEAPGVAEYMQVKEKHKKLLQSVHTWEKKVEVAQMALRTHTKARNAQKAYSAEAGARREGEQMPVKLPYIAGTT